MREGGGGGRTCVLVCVCMHVHTVCVLNHAQRTLFLIVSFHIMNIIWKKDRLPKKTYFSIVPCEFMADDVTLLFYLVFSNDGY